MKSFMIVVHAGRLPLTFRKQYGAAVKLLHENGGTLLFLVDKATSDQVSDFADEIQKFSSKSKLLGIHAAIGQNKGVSFDNTKEKNCVATKGNWVLMVDDVKLYKKFLDGTL